ncbi:branched-chain amino acid ABC transporter permease [Georgenia sp. SYP-B2076]|uniref:branched-chain amino acid ABC transporter permease n=1 Tax=Georgenia sp. SYP-B2076 TaxID=2495881 RepID=UPI0013DF952E|nr:branched-chain amino acid ABC transporter permease [Georgenia sp. SYP-B2076]
MLNGLSFGALLFLVSSGFTLVFGLMRIVNLAHGAFYLLGGYVGVVTMRATGNLLLAIVVGAVAVAVLGLGVERILLRRIRGQELPEVLLTVGVSFVVADMSLAIFGGDPHILPLPGAIAGSVQLGGSSYPVYRLLIIVVTLIVGIGLYLMQRFTRTGAIVRAGVDDREMVAAMGINIQRVFTGMFVFGTGLAALAGVIGSGLVSLRPGVENEILLYALVVVIIGGLGSIKGAAVGAVLIGLIDAFSKAWIPDLSYFTIFAPMALVLVLRPTGLFGRTA